MNLLLSAALALSASFPALPNTFEFLPVNPDQMPHSALLVACRQHSGTATCLSIESRFYTEEPSNKCEQNCCRFEQTITSFELVQKEDRWVNEERGITLSPAGTREWLIELKGGVMSTHADPIKLSCDSIEPA